MRDYRKIIAWQRCHEVTLCVYAITRGFPNDERFALTSQLRRAAYSVPANIVEGCARRSKKEYLHFLNIAMGSAKEMEYFLLLSRDLGYLDHATYDATTEQVDQAIGTLAGLIRAVRKDARV